MFLGFLFLKFLGFLVSKLQRFTKLKLHVFWKILIPYPSFSRIYLTDRRDCSSPSFPTKFSELLSEILKFPKIRFPQTMIWNFLGCLRCLVVSKDNINGFGRTDTLKNPEIIEMRVLGFSHKELEKL